jgi:hypothetical protein
MRTYTHRPVLSHVLGADGQWIAWRGAAEAEAAERRIEAARRELYAALETRVQMRREAA